MERKIITYSLLAHINNQTKSNSSYEAIFIPLVKRGLAKMCNSGQFKGDDLNDIKKHIDELYGLDMPNTILKKILYKIEMEINTAEKQVIKFYSGGSFIISEYVFDEYEEEIQKRSEDLNRLQDFFVEFLKVENVPDQSKSLFDFVEQNKISLGKYINKKYPHEIADNTTEARFVNFIKPFNDLYALLQSVYVGSIISTYLEYQPSGIKHDVELVLDTNFIISLIDLNTINSTENCRRLLEIAAKLGYKFTVLAITLKEIDQLLKTRVDYFDEAFLSKLVDPEDIYNACERRNLTKTDLEQIRNNLVSEIDKFNISIVHHTERYENKAKYSNEYEKLREKRNTSFAALHDATCIEYVKEKRGRPTYEFDKVNCWFVNNSSSRGFYHSNGSQPFIIKAEDLLNLLWLASPMVHSNMSNSELSSIGLSRLVSSTLDDSLPSAMTIRRLDENIQKYAKGNISDEDIVRISKKIAERTISNLDTLNETAEDDQKKFVETLQEIADAQKKKETEFNNLLNRLVSDFTEKTNVLAKKSATIDEERERSNDLILKERNKYVEAVNLNTELLEQNRRIRVENIRIQNTQRMKDRQLFISSKLRRWRQRSWIEVIVSCLLPFVICFFVLMLNHWDWERLNDFVKWCKENVFVSLMVTILYLFIPGFFIVSLKDKYRNHPNIAKFEERLKIPEHLLPLKEEV